MSDVRFVSLHLRSKVKRSKVQGYIAKEIKQHQTNPPLYQLAMVGYSPTSVESHMNRRWRSIMRRHITSSSTDAVESSNHSSVGRAEDCSVGGDP
uniref:Uncharacterized protein n=1 Tax=Steinernema glaseri TaxID=37863 RepID=A0A1I7YKC7_9BILA